MSASSPVSRSARKVPRRGFLNGFLGTSVSALAAAVFYPVARFLSPPRIPEASSFRVIAGKVSEMTSENWKIFPFGSEAAILLKTGEGEYRAFAATCTHLECTVQFHEPSRRIWCACHNGWYDLDGRNVGGPPPRPLESYEVQVVEDDIFVTRS